jgi:hypothetical protein
MTSFQVAQWLRQGIAAAKAGDIDRAYELLLQVVEVDEYNEQAWLWLSSVVESDADREVCLENVLAINPDNKLAKMGLVHLHEKTAQRPVPVEREPEPPSQLEPESVPPPLAEGVEATPAGPEDSVPEPELAPAPASLFEGRLATATAAAPAAAAERERPEPRPQRRPLRVSIRRLALPLLLALGLLAASVAVVAALQSGLFDPARRSYESAMRPLLTGYDVWWEGPQGELVDELNSLCGPGADGWRNRDVLAACSAHPSVDCTLLAAHCGSDVEALRQGIGELSQAAYQEGEVLLEAFAALSPPAEVAQAHVRFLACLQARVAAAGDVRGLARGEPLATPGDLSPCQMFPSAEAQVRAYVGQ